MQPRKPEPYEFFLVTDKTDTYSFTTETKTVYAVRFRYTPYLFADAPNLSEHIYEMVIDLVEVDGRVGPDPRIGPTIVAICEDFLRQQKNVIIYICETADGRHMARVRKFDNWFRQLGPQTFVKIDAKLPDPTGVTYYMSLIVQVTNPDFTAITTAFRQLIADYETGK